MSKSNETTRPLLMYLAYGSSSQGGQTLALS